jgi:hypothetical protein
MNKIILSALAGVVLSSGLAPSASQAVIKVGTSRRCSARRKIHRVN